MTTPFWCLLVAVILPYVFAGAGIRLRQQQLGSIDFEHPRVQALELKDAAARALGAQANAWEALAVFTAAVAVNHLAGGDPGWSAVVAVVFVVARISHGIAYIANVVPLRTLSFVVGTLCSLTLFGLAIAA